LTTPEVSSGEEGIRTLPETPARTALSIDCGAESGAPDTQKRPIDHILAKIIDAWPTLPEPIRTAILALVGTAAK